MSLQFKSPLDAERFARHRREEATGGASFLTEHDDAGGDGPVDHNSSFYKHLFKLQSTIEKEREHQGGMDFREYARRLWKAVTEKDVDDTHENFHAFEKSLIERMHIVGMDVHLYPHMVESLAGLIVRYKDSIHHVSLWSQGDVESTGYQAEKIANTGIINKFFRRLTAALPGEGTARDFLATKTSYDVAGNKFENLVEYVRGAAEREGRIKLLIIEDRMKNFDKARTEISSLGSEIAERVDIEPIWVIYSREGMAAREKVALSEEDFKKVHADLHPVGSFQELLDEKRFGALFKDAHVFVDFDGVIADNTGLHDAQAVATMSACIDGFSKEWGLTREETKERLLNTQF